MPVINLIQNRRDTAANWTSVNPTLAAGELGIETNTNKMKIGTGALWNATPYFAPVTEQETNYSIHFLMMGA